MKRAGSVVYHTRNCAIWKGVAIGDGRCDCGGLKMIAPPDGEPPAPKRAAVSVPEVALWIVVIGNAVLLACGLAFIFGWQV